MPVTHPSDSSQLRIGVIQGRLSPRPAGKLQEFPWASYAQEFDKAARLGFHCIEWIFEAERYRENPLWSSSGRAEIHALVERSGVKVQSICADYFMLRRLAGEAAGELAHNRAILRELIQIAGEVGADRILLPLLETSAPSTLELRTELIAALKQAAPVAEACGVTLGLEMEIPGSEYAALIEQVGSPRVRAYYDTGNSTAQGLDIGRDITPLLPLLCAVHVKDRVRGGTSRPLGSGDANFRGFFAALARAGFRGDLVLQHYFEHEPEREAEQSLAFVRQLLANARAEAA